MLKNTQLSSAIDDTERLTSPLDKSAVLKKTQPIPPEIKEIKRVPYEESITVLRNTQLSFASDDTEGCRAHYIKPAVLKNTQPSPPEIKTKTYLRRNRAATHNIWYSLDMFFYISNLNWPNLTCRLQLGTATNIIWYSVDMFFIFLT